MNLQGAPLSSVRGYQKQSSIMKVKKPSMLRMLHKNQRGFTLIEMVTAVAIIGLIAGAATTAIYQVFSGNARSSSHMTAVRQVQNAGYWISLDGQMAQKPPDGFLIGDDEGTSSEVEVLTLSWVGWEYKCGDSDTDTCINSHEVRYTYDEGSKKLWRLETITIAQYDSDGEPVDPQPPPQNSITFIAEYITPIPMVTMDEDENKLTVPITASVTSWVGEAVEERTYEITPRPSPSD